MQKIYVTHTHALEYVFEGRLLGYILRDLALTALSFNRVYR